MYDTKAMKRKSNQRKTARTSLFFYEDQLPRLAEKAQELGVCQSALIREAVDLFLQKDHDGKTQGFDRTEVR